MRMMLTDKIVLVTGATSGLGRHLAEQLAAQDATLLLHGRDPDRLQTLCRRLRDEGASVYGYVSDLAHLFEVRELALRVLRDWPRLDVLINNAGTGPGAEGAPRELSQDGYELRFAVGYLAPFLLSRLLLPALRCSASARVANVVSGVQVPIDLGDLQMAGSYHGWVAYGRAKLALASFTMDFAEEVYAEGIAVNCVHPANFMPTAMVKEIGAEPQSTLWQGGEAVLRLVRPSVAGSTGHYYNGLTPASPHDDVLDAMKRRLLREVTEYLLAQASRRPTGARV
ncbi:SDR family NAD(P)-dependent oxidoreductase [Streptomyces violascens]|uniref:SDR family NAD(P)-dependent oxidoreductase n=1 Tax=Streptomyces violascens TaxID=67381 RepID=UPI0036667A69